MSGDSGLSVLGAGKEEEELEGKVAGKQPSVSCPWGISTEWGWPGGKVRGAEAPGRPYRHAFPPEARQ